MINFKNVIQTMHKAGRTVSKHSPAIFTTLGVVGLGATAYTTYKASKKVEAITEDIEDARKLGMDVNRMEVAKDLTGALALPVSLAVGSVVCIGLSYHIQNKRILGLAGALSALQSERRRYRDKYKAIHGEEAYEEFVRPTEETSDEIEDAEGKKQKVIKKVDIDDMNGFWFDKSDEYFKDDHDYNMQFIRSKQDQLEFRLFRKGFLLMNEVRNIMGLESTKAGALMGWSVKDGFDISPKVTNVVDEETGTFRPEIYVHWVAPKYVYGDINYKNPDEAGYATK